MSIKTKADQSDLSHRDRDQAASGQAQSAVGYKRPPTHTQFKKGYSGHRKGRPLGSTNFSTLFDEVLAETIAVREGGRIRRISKAQALVNVALQFAFKGNVSAIRSFLLLADKTEQLTPEPESEKRFGWLVVPGVATPEEWQKEALEALKAGQERDTRFKEASEQKPQKRIKIYKDVDDGKVTIVPIE